MVRARKTTFSHVVSRLAVQSSCTEQAAARFKSRVELRFQYGKSVRKLRGKLRREENAVRQWRLVRSSGEEQMLCAGLLVSKL